MVIVLMGAAGAGKTTIGSLLSERLRWKFLDGDAVHPLENIAKMASGVPLTDEDRRPWLEALRKSIRDLVEKNVNAVVACSLLTQAHRTAVLAGYEHHVKLVYLQASRPLLEERLAERTGHFAGVALLDSQIALLEEPVNALVLDASQPSAQLIRIIRNKLNL